MKMNYKGRIIDIDDRILKCDRENRNQIINEQFIHYAIAISTPTDFPENQLSDAEIKKMVESSIISDIGDILGYDLWKKYGINAYEDENGEVIWNDL